MSPQETQQVAQRDATEQPRGTYTGKAPIAETLAAGDRICNTSRNARLSAGITLGDAQQEAQHE